MAPAADYSSALLVNVSRSRQPALSRDPWAGLWVDDSVRALWDEFAREVYPHDDVEVAVRDRYFLEALERFLRASPDGVFANIGAGLVAYPFLISPAVPVLEADLPGFSEFRRARLAELQARGRLPRRRIRHVGADLLRPGERLRLRRVLKEEAGGRPSFVLMAGFTYHMDRESLDALLDICREVQIPGSLLAFDYFDPSLLRHPIHARLREFFSRRFGPREREYLCLPRSFPGSLSGYRLLEGTDVVAQERAYSKTPVLLDPERVFPENYAVLERL